VAGFVCWIGEVDGADRELLDESFAIGSIPSSEWATDFVKIKIK